MKIYQLQPGHTIFEHHDNGFAIHYEVVSIEQKGSRYEVTLRSPYGQESALYPANAIVQVAA